MKKPTVRELERLLAADAGGEPSPEPPAGLAERIKADVPDVLPRPPIDDDGDAEAPVGTGWSAHRWRLAAVLAMTLGGGSLAWWLWQDRPSMSSLEAPAEPATVSSTDARSAGEAEREAVAPEVAETETGAESDRAALRDRVASLRRRTDETLRQERRRLETLEETVGGDETTAAGDGDVDRREQNRQLKALGYLAQAEPATEPEAATRARTAPAPPPLLPSAPPSRGARSSAPPSSAGRAAPDDAGRDLDDLAYSLREEPRPRARGKRVPVPDPAPVEESKVVREGEVAAAYPATPSVQAEPPPPPSQPPAPSTGGTAEPNDQPYGDVFFEHAGVNPFLDPEEDRLSTFGLDVDTGSWGVVRRYLEDGHLPPPAAVRVEEVVNALDYGDPAPEEGDFALIAEGAPSPFAGSGPVAERYRVLRFAVKAREIAAADRKPAALTFVVDVSGSMAREDRLGLVQRSLRLLVERLDPDDRVGLVIYGSRGEVVLEATSDHAAILAAVDRLAPGGSTNAEEGLKLGYRVASRALRPGAINRVILCSDGVANVGATGPDSILESVRREAARGIELTTLGFGMGNYNDVLMERLADAGDGRYAYLDSLDEARRILVEQLTGTLETVAGEARAQVELNPEVVERYRLLGYENRDIADERFRDDTVDAGEIGAGHTVTALYEVKLRQGLETPAGVRAYGGEPVATLRLRWRSVAGGAEGGGFVEAEETLRVGELAATWEDARPALKLAVLAAEMAEILRRSYWARDGSLEEVFRRLQRLQPELAGNRQAAELTALAGRAARLAGETEAASGSGDDGR